MSKRSRTSFLSIPLVGWLLVTQACDYTGTGPDPMQARFDDPPVIYTFLNSKTGHETAVRISFTPYLTTYSATTQPGFTFLRQAVPGQPLRPRSAASIRAGQDTTPLPLPDEFMFDPFDIPEPPDPFDDLFPNFPDPFDEFRPPPDPLDDPFPDLPDPPLDLPPLPGGDLPNSNYSSGTVNITNVGGTGSAQAHNYLSPLSTKAASTTITVRGTVQVGPGAAGIVMSPDRKTIYVAVSNANIAVVDRHTMKVTSRINLPAAAQPYALAITPDGTRLYTGEFNVVASATAYSIDLPSGTVKALSPLGSVITQMIVTPDGAQLWACNHFGNAVYIFDVLTNTFLTQIPLSYPWNVAFNASGTRAYITNGPQGAQGAVNVYDTASLQTITSIPVGTTPRNIRISATGRHAFVTNYDSAFLSQIDLTTNKLLRNIPLPGPGASGIAFSHN